MKRYHMLIGQCKLIDEYLSIRFKLIIRDRVYELFEYLEPPYWTIHDDIEKNELWIRYTEGAASFIWQVY